ncbi:MAG: hypothetical protein AAB074_07880 [Planctomycetota bacterium]
MKIFALFAAFCAMASSVFAQGHPEWDARALVHLLADEDSRIRDAAEEELSKRGRSVEALVEEALGRQALDAEAKARLSLLQGRLKRIRLGKTRLDREAEIAIPGGEAALLAFGCDGKRLAGVSASGRVAVWASSGELLTAFDVPVSPEALALGRSGNRIAVAGGSLVALADISDLAHPVVTTVEVDSQVRDEDALAIIALGNDGLTFVPRPAGWFIYFLASPSGNRAAWGSREGMFAADLGHPEGSPSPERPPGWGLLGLSDSGEFACAAGRSLWIRGRLVTECSRESAASPGADAVASTTILGRIEVWTADGQPAWSRMLPGPASRLALAPGGATAVVSVVNRGVFLLTATDQIPLSGLAAPCDSLFFTGDSRFLVASGRATVVLDTATGNVRELPLRSSSSAAWGRGDEFVACTRQGLRKWSSLRSTDEGPVTLGETGPWIEVQPSPAGNAVAFVRDDLTAGLATEDGSVRELGGGFEPGSLRWSPDGASILAATYEGRLRITLFDAVGAKVSSEPSEWSYTRALAWSPDGRRVAWASKRDARFAESCDLAAGVSLGENVAWLGFLDDGVLLSLDGDRRTFRFHQLPDPEPAGARVPCDAPIRRVALSPDRHRLALSDDSRIFLVRIER